MYVFLRLKCVEVYHIAFKLEHSSLAVRFELKSHVLIKIFACCCRENSEAGRLHVSTLAPETEPSQNYIVAITWAGPLFEEYYRIYEFSSFLRISNNNK
jgi:hypothetical protein